MVDKVDKIWFDGELIPWEQANVHVLTHTLHYGVGVFEGIRCYKLADGRSAVFRLEDHVRRLFESAHICMLPMPYSREQVVEACLETVRVNGLDECYIRPIAFMGDGAMGLGAHNDTRVAVIAWRWGAYLGDEGLAKGIRAKVSSYTRPGINSLMSKGKIVGHYVNSIMAKREALAGGYDEAILLDPKGHVSEASGENIFVVRDGKVATPASGGSMLIGITRDTVIKLLQSKGIEVEQRLISRDELYIADEVFMVGTAAEVTPVRELDNRKVGTGARGPITEQIQRAYFDTVKGVEPPNDSWLSVI
ncbi:MAG: branched-chain amino acid transaminase [Myxococcota bacterium]